MMKESKEKEKEAVKFWWFIEDADCFTQIYGEEMKDYIKRMIKDSHPNKVVIQIAKSSGEEHKEESSGCEEEDELEEEENDDEDIKKNENQNSNSYASALRTIGGGLRSPSDYQDDYWIGDSGASSHLKCIFQIDFLCMRL